MMGAETKCFTRPRKPHSSCPRAFGVVPPATSFRSAPEQKDLVIPPWMTITLTSGSVSKRSSAEPHRGAAELVRHVGVARVVHVRAVEGQQADGTPSLDEQGPGCCRGDGTVGAGHPASLAADRNETETRTGEITLAVLRSTQQGDTISGRRSVRFPHEEYHVTERRTTTFDHHGADLPHRSHDVYAEMRGACPGAWTV